MMRKVLAVVLGFGLWSLLWVGVNAGLRAGAPDSFPEGDYFDATLILALLLTLSVVCSLAAGVALRLGRARRRDTGQ